MIALLATAGAKDDALVVLDGTELAFHGFVDAGWFDVTGDGVSYRYERARRDGTWAYTGDPWAATVNSQGDVADLGNGFNNVQRADAIGVGGRPTFLVNTLEQALALRRETASMVAAVWVEPRSGDLGDLGDRVSVDRAWVEWAPDRPDRTERVRWRFQVGKLESVFGREWYERRAPERLSVTPSLVARYTTGTPVGVAAHAEVARRVELSLSATNGGTTTERFGHFQDELDTNGVPTATARVGLRFPGLPSALVGVSGQVGAQDGVVEPIPMFQVGGDLAINGKLWFLRAEYLVSDQDQGRPGQVDRLFAHGGYLQLSAALRPWLSPLARVDRRVADLSLAAGNTYASDTVRLALGARFDLTYNLVAKAELLHLEELGGDEIDDDVITTSVVFRY